MELNELREIVRDKNYFIELDQYFRVCRNFLTLLKHTKPTKIISPAEHNYVFYQFGEEYGHKITRPLNTDLFVTKRETFERDFDRFRCLLTDLRRTGNDVLSSARHKRFLNERGINKIIYTIQQSVGSISDAFENPNQSRKRIGQIFEQLIVLLVKKLGFECEPRTIQIPVPDHPGRSMSYQLDLVFSRGRAIVAAEDELIGSDEIIGSVKTTSKDRIDKVFLDKFLICRLLGKQVPVIAVFLHDVQRARKGESNFGIAGTFKSNHFLGYTWALNPLDGVYYVDPRPNMLTNPHLREHIHDVSQFLTRDLWSLTSD